MAVGENKEVEISFKKGDEIHFWEDYDKFTESGAGLGASKNDCYSWNITIHEDGNQKLKCESLRGNRCDEKINNKQGVNCKVPDCIATVKKGGQVKVQASLEKTGDCKVGVRGMTLRIRKVSP
jgi:hypothetical protein